MQAPKPLPQREERIAQLTEKPLDVLIVGGGITGSGLALDLQMRGLRTAIVERGDWAGATSSASSRLIHGGLRYLEQLEIGLVRESCLERGLLMKNAAGMVWPERFLFPLHRGFESPTRLKLMAGLGLYTLVSIPRMLGLPKMHGRGTVQGWLPGVRTQGLVGGGSYLDGASDDARLTLAVVATAMEQGAIALSRMEATAFEDSTSAGTRVQLTDRRSGQSHEVETARVVLCGGPFTEILRGKAGLDGRWVQPTRGTHITVPRDRLPTQGAIIFASPVDGRVMFLIPWPNYTVIGTTDLDADPKKEVAADAEEVRYLLDSANGLVPTAQLKESDVVSSWAGLRPLLASNTDDPSARSREERVEREGNIYTIAGGKLTGYRSMAEKLGQRIARELSKGNKSAISPTRTQALRGALSSVPQRPSWSDGRASDPRTHLDHVFDRRYAGLRPFLEKHLDSVTSGRDPLDEETLLGEIDWAADFEDCLGIEDFCLRRTDLGYGPRSKLEAEAERILARLQAKLHWTPKEVAQQRDELAAMIRRVHGWRSRAPENRAVEESSQEPHVA